MAVQVFKLKCSINLESTRCWFKRSTFFAACVVTSMQSSNAQEFPSKPIHFIVPYTAGGTTDLVARTVGAHMARSLRQSVVIENRGGAGGNIGMDVVAKAAADGYTIGMGAISTNALNPHLYRSMPFDPRKDFTAVGLLGNSTIVLEVHPSVAAKNVTELINYVKQHPDQAFATAGSGTSMHLAGVLFSQLSQTKWTHVAYKGSAPLLKDMLGGQVKVAFDNLPASLPHIQAGKLRALAVAGSQRSSALPDVPTMAEAGINDYSVEPWFAVYAPAGLSKDRLVKLNSALVAALDDEGVKEKLSKAGFTPRGSTPSELQALTSTEYERLGKVAREAQMSID